jgi:Glycosyltransferase family 87
MRARLAIAARELAVPVFVVVLGVFLAFRLLDVYPWNARIFDLWAYWSTRAGLEYSAATPGTMGDYLYSPAFAQLIAPLAALPLPVFTTVWTVLVGAIFLWLAGRWATLFGLVPLVAMSVAIGQLDLPFAAVIVIGFRYPAVWFLPVITKITPGVGLLWYAARREWRSFLIAAGTTALVVIASIAIDPAAWRGWLGMLTRLQFPTFANGIYLPVSVWFRLPVAAGIIIWGARRDRRWTLPLGVCLALPTVWLNSPTILIAALALSKQGYRTPAGRWLQSSGMPAWATIRLARLATWSTGLRRLPVIARQAAVERGWMRDASSVDR